MADPTTVRPFASVLCALALAAGCAGPSERSESVEQVDELLTRIERVQAETAVAKDAVHAALDELCRIVSPGFQGDAAAEFAKFIAASERSEEQGETLRDVTEPMQEAASDVFQRWTKDMEAFGNSRLRQRSQTRLDETRTRFQGIVGATQAAQISLDAFHDDMRDLALFLRHDLNSAAVASIRTDVRALNEQIRDVDTRFDATVAAARAYVESAALYGQVDVVEDAEPTATPAAPPGTSASGATETSTKSATGTTTPRKRTVTTLKPKAAAKESRPATAEPKPAVVEPAPPAPEGPAPQPAPETPPQGSR